MNFQTLLEPDCGQSNPISQLVQHVTDDQRFQENIGNPYTFGPNQNNLMHPQSFRMNDLIKELGQVESQGMSIPSSSSSHIDVQPHFSQGTIWTTEYQNQMQGYPQANIDQIWNGKNSHNCGNETSYFFSNEGFINASRPLYYGLPKSENFINNDESQTVKNLTYHLEVQSQEPEKSLAEFKGGVTIQSLDELEKLDQSGETSTSRENIQDKQLPKPLPETENEKTEKLKKDEKKSIPEFKNARHFMRIMSRRLEEFRKNELQPDYKKRNNITLESLLSPMEYSYIENNPLRNEWSPAERGKAAVAKASYSKAVLYFDEAVRRNGDAFPIMWYYLSYSLYRNDQDDKAIAALKHYLRLRPNCFSGIHILWAIYNKYSCKYQACQTILNWLKNNKSYNHLIPPDFAMDDKMDAELDDALLDTVKSLVLKAARENRKNVDSDLQLMIGNLYTISNDFDKVNDCKRAAIKSSNKRYAGHLYNMGYSLFYDEKPYEALDSFFEAAAREACPFSSYQAIGYLYTYLKNFRQAIHYFKKALGPDILSQQSKFQLKGNTLEDEYDLCLRMYCESRNK